MKTLYKLSIALLFTISCFTHIAAQTNSGSITMGRYDWEYDWDCDCGDSIKTYTLNVSPNTPIKINLSTYTYDYISIYTQDNQNNRNYYGSDYPTEGVESMTIISSTGKIYIYAHYYWYEQVNDTVFTLNYNVDPTYSISSSPSIIQNDQYIGGKLGIGVMPTEKLEVNGNAIMKKLAIGTSYIQNNVNLKLYCDYYNVIYRDITTSIQSDMSKSTSNSVYGIKSNLSNYSSGNVYGIYSSVYGQTGKKWAGYFYGGDVEVAGGGNIFLNSENSVITAMDDNLGIVKKYGQSPVWAVGSGYAHRFGKWSTPTLKGNIGTGTFTEQMRIDNNGNVGIGTTTPFSKLDVAGEIKSTLNSVSNIRMTGGSYSSMLRNDGANTYVLLTNNNDVNGGWNTLRPLRVSNSTGDISFADEKLQIAHSTGTIIATGKIGIGLTDAATKLAASPADELLTVNGTIHAKELRVDLTGSLADYVFSPDYSLMPLHKVEAFVKTNKHLPEIPSAAEVKEKGLNMGEMQNKLLLKIEELTLYVIELQKTNEKQSAEIEELKRK